MHFNGQILLLLSLCHCLVQEVTSICDRSVTEWTVDSTVLIDNRLYLFIDFFIIEVNIRNKTDIIRYNISQLFDFKDKKFEHRVDIAFIYKTAEEKEPNLILISKNTKWIVSTKDYSLVRTEDFYALKPPLDIINIDSDVDQGYGLFLFDYQELGGNYLMNVVLENNGYYSIGSTFFLRERVANNVSEVTFFDVLEPSNQTNINDMLNNSRRIYQLNGFNITSGILVPNKMKSSIFKSDKIVLFANQYFIEVSPKANEWTELEVKNITELICNAKESQIIGPEKAKRLLAFVVLAMVIILVFLIAVLFCYFFCVPSNNAFGCMRNQCSDDKQSDEKKRERRKSDNSSALKSGTFSVTSNRDYSQPIPVTTSKTDASGSSILTKPTDLRINSSESIDQKTRSDLEVVPKSETI